VALIQIQAEGLVPVDLGDSDGLRVGHYAFILGNSFGNLTPSFGFAQEIDRTQDLIHIAAPVHPGYGGAPVFCSTGEVVGMVWAAVDPWSAFRAPDREGAVGPVAWQEAQTTVYVVPINRAARIAGQLSKARQPVYGYLGIQGELYPDGGVRVVDIAADGPAASSGISTGDLIMSYEGAPVQNLWHFIYMVLTTTPGTSANLDLLRNGQRVAAEVRVGQMAPEVFNELVAKMMSNPSGQDGGAVMPVGPGLAKPVGLGPPGAFGLSQDPRVVFQEIDKLEREILRLRQQLMKGGR
jgi:serine protease Do